MIKSIPMISLLVAAVLSAAPAYSQSTVSTLGTLNSGRKVYKQAENLELFKLLIATGVEVKGLFDSQQNYGGLSNELILLPTGRKLIKEWQAKFAPARYQERDGFQIQLPLNKGDCEALFQTPIGLEGPFNAAAVNGKVRSKIGDKLCVGGRFSKKNIVTLFAY
ncbi:hypothetical protein HFO33_35465 [Rhizobium leguminosarum]|uniref:hypothetical protein n=1 Tax=Rhizobium leguminosarum TaxID=384 RepID=UPI001C95C2EE|nr:hypothetical protein [Rhizobium leguminosarum]MBY5721788.1 hypothetical protein [Rhizobium leguminosarum]